MSSLTAHVLPIGTKGFIYLPAGLSPALTKLSVLFHSTYIYILFVGSCLFLGKILRFDGSGVRGSSLKRCALATLCTLWRVHWGILELLTYSLRSLDFSPCRLQIWFLSFFTCLGQFNLKKIHFRLLNVVLRRVSVITTSYTRQCIILKTKINN